jgi:hypothetical protein
MKYMQDNKPKLTLTERAKQHQLLHPNDTNTRRVDRGIHWSNKTEKDKKLDLFYKTHVHTWVSEGNKAWVRVAQNDEVGEEE